MEEAAVLRACTKLRRTLESWLRGAASDEAPYQVLGPAPAAVMKVNNRYRYRITLMCKNSRTIRAMLSELIRLAQTDKENRGVSVFGDCNPME